MTRGLSVLPRFRVRTVTRPADGEVLLEGITEGLEQGGRRIWLWLSEADAVTAMVEEVGETVLLRIDTSAASARIAVGDQLRWHDAYWDAELIRMILRGPWVRKTFVARDARRFRIDGVGGWAQVGGVIPRGAVDEGVVPGGWDHEHCEVCRARIGVGGADVGFVGRSDRWLCPSCHERWAKEPDLGFVVGS